MKKTKILLIITIIFVMGYHSMNNFVGFQAIEKKENPQTSLIEPNKAEVSINISKVGQFYDGGLAYGIHVNEDYAYLADGDNGLEIIDVSDPSAPVEVGQFYDGGIAFDVFVREKYAYIADDTDGLEIIDISDPTAPVEVGQFNDGGNIRDVYILDSYAYLADHYNSFLEIIDISDPANPIEVGQFNSSRYLWEIYVLGSYAYLANDDSGLKIINISDPTAPMQVGQLVDGYQDITDIYVSMPYAYIGSERGFFWIIRISNPTELRWIGTFENWESIEGLFGLGPYAYVGDSLHSLRIIDISDPTFPKEIAEFVDEPHNISDIYVLGSYAYIASDYGLEILHIISDDVEHSISITSPDGSLPWKNRSLYVINWDYTGYIPVVDIELYKKGVFEEKIASYLSNEGYCSWRVSYGLVNSTYYHIKIIDTFNSSVFDYSEYFEIVNFQSVPEINEVDDIDDKNVPFSIHGYDIILLLSTITIISIVYVFKRKKLF